MFGGEASDKPVKVLSGGERSRLAMIALLLRPVNFLILDEPTNHLDMQTKEILKDALLQFDGTMIVVSHDRSFLTGLVDRVYVFGDGKVREHIGGIGDYLERLRLREGDEASPSRAKGKAGDGRGGDAKERRQESVRLSFGEQQQRRNALRGAQKKVAEAEAEVTRLEGEKKRMEADLATPEGAADSELAVRYSNLLKEIDAAVEQWMKRQEQLDELKE